VKNIALYFGSFNPIHQGHLIIAQHVINAGFCDELWFVVSPHNPHKYKIDLAPAEDRLAMCKLAVDDHSIIKVSDIEFHLPTPSFTIQTLDALQEKYPDYNFSIVMGQDSVENLHTWKQYEDILKYKIFYYPRLSGDAKDIVVDTKSITKLNDAPIIELSSTQLRADIRNNISILYRTPKTVVSYIEANELYR
jgi:nicotinate-nucleotide adenylyltransferase